MQQKISTSLGTIIMLVFALTAGYFVYLAYGAIS